MIVLAAALGLDAAALPASAQQGAISQTGSAPLRPTAPSAPRSPGTWYVDASSPIAGKGTLMLPFRSLATALAWPKLRPGDKVLVFPGTYAGPVVAPPFGVKVRSLKGAQETRIDGQGSSPALVLAGTNGVPFELEGFTLQNGVGSAVAPVFSVGGGLQAQSARFELRDCVIERNDAFWGGGVYALNSVGKLSDCSISFNTNTGFGARGAGVLVDGGSLAIERCRLALNTSGDFFAPGHGGGIYAQGTVDLDVLDSVIELNVAELGGGGVFGAGDYVGCVLRGNEGQFGGGAQASAGTFFTDCLIEDNVAISLGGTSHFGGGVWGPGVLERCTVRNNVAWGGTAGVEGAVLIDSLVHDNYAVPGFGGVGTLSGGVMQTVALGSTIGHNLADGGGLYSALGGGASQSTLIDCDIDSNEVRPGLFAAGGGTHACDVRRSRFSRNLASGRGGGAYLGTLRHTVLYDNQAEAGGGAADADLEHCTLEGNRASFGGGVYVSSGKDVDVHGTILYWNLPDQLVVDASGLVQVEYSDVLGGWPGIGNFDADPDFWQLAAHDYHLLPSSPCIDAGDPLDPPDPDGSVEDVGALWADPDYVPDGDETLGGGVKP